MIFYLFPSLQQKDKYLVCEANYANHDGMKAVKRWNTCIKEKAFKFYKKVYDIHYGILENH